MYTGIKDKIKRKHQDLDEYGGIYVKRPTTHVYKYQRYNKNRRPIDSDSLLATLKDVKLVDKDVDGAN